MKTTFTTLHKATHITAIAIGLSLPLLLSACGGSGSAATAVQAPTVGHAYLIAPTVATIYNYDIGNNGALYQTSTQALPVAAYGYAIATAPSGQFVLVADNTTGTIYTYTIGTNGVLSSAPTATSQSPASTYPSTLAIDATSQFAYAINPSAGNNSVSEFAISSTGTLTSITGSPLSLGSSSPTAIAINPKAQIAYILTNNSLITEYTIGSDGTLTPATTAPVSAEGAYSLAINPTGQYVYLATTAGVLEYSIAANGSLTAISTPVALSGDAPYSIAVDPTNSFAYITSTNSSTILVYSIGVNGVLAPLPSLTAPSTYVTSLAVTSHL